MWKIRIEESSLTSFCLIFSPDAPGKKEAASFYFQQAWRLRTQESK